MGEPQYRILIVDDEELNVRFLSTFLTREGFDIVMADSGQAALARIGEHMPDVVLLDALMPDMDGFEVCRRLRANEQTRLLPVIMITALNRVEDEVKALDAGADDFLPKPINRIELMARVRSLLRIKTLHDQLCESKAELEKKHGELIAVQAMRDSLTQMIVHDLKNPLTGIMGSTELLLSFADPLTERQRSMIGKIENSSAAMLQMITDMLDIGRMEENKMTLHRERFGIDEIFDANLGEFSSTMTRDDMAACVEIADGTPPLEADKSLIHRVVANLMHNAIKHSVRHGRIWLRAAGENGGVLVSIQDEGEGIAKEYTDVIFEKFAQAEMRKRGLKSDRGLGLAFCKLAVEAHGGRIWVESEIGTGSAFKFYLPSEVLQ